MWDEYCRKFRGGICQKIKDEYSKPLHVPRVWCIHVCRGNWDGKTLNRKGLGKKLAKPAELDKSSYIHSIFYRDKHPLKIYRGNLLAQKQRTRQALTSVIITAGKEKLLNDTIKNLTNTAAGKIEVIVVDKKTAGRRQCLNEAVATAKGEFLFFCNAECLLSPGWDLKLKVITNPDNIGVAVMRICKDSSEVKEFVFYVFDQNLHACKRLAVVPKNHRPLIVQSMCFADGDAWMITKKRWDALGGSDMSLGESGNEGLEWSMKIQLQHKEHLGKVYIHSGVTCRHYYKSNLTYRLFISKSISQREARKKMIDLYSKKSIGKLITNYFALEGHRPVQTPPPELAIEQMKADYVQAKIQMTKLGREKELVSQDEYIRRRIKCKECNGGFKCPDFCCGLPTKVAKSSWKCKKGKW